MIKAVIDTNVLASGFVRSEPAPGQILRAWSQGSFALVVSSHILTELRNTFESPYFATRLTPEQRAANVALLEEEAVIQPLHVSISGVATHPEDDQVLATAISARADYLVTGDRQLLRLQAFREVNLVSAADFLRILRSASNRQFES